MSLMLCQACNSEPKLRTQGANGTTVIHAYCGGRHCRNASSNSLLTLPATIPSPAAAEVARTTSTKLVLERANSVFGRSILTKWQKQWKSDRYPTAQLKSIYRLETGEQLRRRFDLALQLNDGYPVYTTYYGGSATCTMTAEKDPTPCQSESCDICDVLRSCFDNMPHGISSRDGEEGFGAYTYRNPAEAHQSQDSEEETQTQGIFAMIQCRVITQPGEGSSSGLTAGALNAAGVVFCSRPLPIIPTHLLVYRVDSTSHRRRTSTGVSSPSPAALSARTRGLPPMPAPPPLLLGIRFNGLPILSTADQNQLPTRTAPVNDDPQVTPLPPSPGPTATPAKLANPFQNLNREEQQIGGGSPASAQQPMYQSNLASPGPGTLYTFTPAGPIPVPHPAPANVALYVVGPDGRFYPAQTNQPQDSDAGSRQPTRQSSYPGSKRKGRPKKVVDDEGPTERPGQPKKADDDDDDPKVDSAAAARKFEKSNKDLNTRLDEDDDFYLLKPATSIARP